MLDISSEKFPYIKAGDFLICHHNFFLLDPDYGGQYLLEHDFISEVAWFSIPVTRNIYARITKDGVEPVCENLICERIETPHNSIIERPFPVYYTDRVRVVKKSPEVNGINIGDVIGIHKYGDMEIVFNLDNKEQRVVKVWQEDFWGTIKETQNAD